MGGHSWIQASLTLSSRPREQRVLVVRLSGGGTVGCYVPNPGHIMSPEVKGTENGSVLILLCAWNMEWMAGLVASSLSLCPVYLLAEPHPAKGAI